MSEHFLQSRYWREIKERLGNETYDFDNYWFQTTKIPLIGKKVGYIPRIGFDQINWQNLFEQARLANCAFVSIDPIDRKESLSSASGIINKIMSDNPSINLKKGSPTHLQENVVINLKKSVEELLASMKPKHRYNLKLSQKKGVSVVIDSNEIMFEEFLKLYSKTARRQNYFGRSETYLRTVWNYLKELESETNSPKVFIATAYYEKIPLSSWFLITYQGVIYYPYGGSSDEYRNVMATYSLVWEIINWGMNRDFSSFDLWGIERDNSGEFDGFSRFKLGFGGEIICYEDTVDLILNKRDYYFVRLMINLRYRLKRFKR